MVNKNSNDMNRKHQENQKISRKNFLQIAGSVIAGGTILGSTGYLIGNRSRQLNIQGTDSQALGESKSSAAFQSPYKLVSSFATPDKIDAFECHNDKIIVAASNRINMYQQTGKQVSSFSINGTLRDVVVANELIYLLFPARIEVYHLTGELKQQWDACSDNADYCSLAVTPYHLFVTDASNKNICQYTIDGALERFIESPNRFIIPSYTFGITYANNSIYCSNPGRHSVERYSVKGIYMGAFGTFGNEPENFCGCCNPVYIDYTSAGDIITSEKGNPRISCYDSEGNFRNLLLDANMLGGGNVAYDIKVSEDKIYVAGNKMVSTFQYDRNLASRSGCSTCGINCPLREGITV